MEHKEASGAHFGAKLLWKPLDKVHCIRHAGRICHLRHPCMSRLGRLHAFLDSVLEAAVPRSGAAAALPERLLVHLCICRIRASHPDVLQDAGIEDHRVLPDQPHL